MGYPREIVFLKGSDSSAFEPLQLIEKPSITRRNMFKKDKTSLHWDNEVFNKVERGGQLSNPLLEDLKVIDDLNRELNKSNFGKLNVHLL